MYSSTRAKLCIALLALKLYTAQHTLKLCTALFAL